MGLNRVKPQLVEHTDGWRVAGAGRYAVSYSEDGRTATVAVERGQEFTYVDAATAVWLVDGEEVPVDDKDRPRVLARVMEGLEAMGVVPRLENLG